ncbi:MAG: hypothetical protein A2X12_05100 [Bacteroidetes bacterium GWE2_29_8]|nr:MAG: hypothetical protein A2X12_05100 [Bacteroidetes bacterium GWE2_29_8]
MSQEKAKILIVEDEVIVAMDMQNTLNSAGYDVVAIVGKGSDAIVKAKMLLPDIILMDIMLMGSIDGIEAATRITEENDIPLLFLTANSDTKILERAKMVAPYGYILKPFSMQELIINIDIAIYKHSTKKEIALNQKKYKDLYEKLATEIAEREKIEKRLSISEERFLKVFKYSPDAINVNKLDGTYLEINQKFIELIGYTKDEIIGKTSIELDIYENPEDRYKMVEMLLKKGEIQDLEINFKNKAGSIIIASMNAVIVSFNDEQCIVSITRDITEHKRIENELKRQEDRYHNQYMHNPMPTYTWVKNNEDFQLFSFNIAGRLLTNDEVINIIGIKASDFFSEYPEIITDMHSVFNNKTIKRREVLYKFKLINRALYIDFTMAYSPENNIVIYAENITARKQAEIDLKHYNLELQKSYHDVEQINEELTSAEEELRQQLDNLTQNKDILFQSKEKLNTIVANIPFYIAQIDANLKYLFVNKNYAELQNSNIEDIVGKYVYEVISKEDFEFVIPFINNVLLGERQSFEQFRKPLNKTINGLYIPNKNRKGDVSSYIFIGEDVTTKVEVENFQKEMEVYKRTTEIKQQFLANMSHEMRTPMCGIIGLTELISNTELNEKQKEFIDTIKDSSNSLLTLINNILDISKIEAGKMQIKQNVFNFHKTISYINNLFSAIITNKGLNLEIQIAENIPKFIKSDEYRIKQILNNLVSNAIKFTNSGSININVSVAKEMQEYILIKISIIDTGIGISEDNKKLLFQKFSQVDYSNSRLYEGAGLGLSIVKELVTMLDGEIHVESVEGQGSNFWFTFKANKTKLSDKEELVIIETLEQKYNFNFKILLVEDKAVNYKVIRLMLENIGCSVDIAENGQIALKKVSKNVYDLIFMDIMMPIMDGITATKRIKELYKNAPPIIGLSANAMDGDAEKYKNEGLDDYITKPVFQETLISIIKKYLL